MSFLSKCAVMNLSRLVRVEQERISVHAQELGFESPFYGARGESLS